MFSLKVKNKWWYLLIILSCLHLFFINIKDSHDWGDDFAQYIHQSKNIVQGISQQETGFIYNKNYPVYSPNNYYIGFPLLLSPVYALAGNNMEVFNYFISTFFFLCAIIFFAFFKKNLGSIASFLLILIIVYNPWMLNFKMEISSDIPFTFFLYLSILIYYSLKKTIWSFLLLGLLAGFLISIRSIGISFIVAVVINELLILKSGPSNYSWKKLFFHVLIFSMVSIGFFAFLNHMIFDIPFENFNSYARLFTFKEVYETALKNLNYYFGVFQSLFDTHPENTYALFSTIIKSIMLSLVLLGFFIRLKNKISFSEIFLIIYLIVLCMYPYTHSGYRFLIPVTPILLLYAAEALKFLKDALQWKKSILYCLCIVAFYAVYQFEWKIILDNQNMVLQGPQRMDAQQLFEYIKTNTPKDARILFEKPRALALYTARSCMTTDPNESPENIEAQLTENNIEYVLINEEISDAVVKNFIFKTPEKMEIVWSNSNFRIYKLQKMKKPN